MGCRKWMCMEHRINNKNTELIYEKNEKNISKLYKLLIFYNFIYF